MKEMKTNSYEVTVAFAGVDKPYCFKVGSFKNLTSGVAVRLAANLFATFTNAEYIRLKCTATGNEITVVNCRSPRGQFSEN